MERPEHRIRGRIVVLSLMICTGKVKTIAAKPAREPLCGAPAGVLTNGKYGRCPLPDDMRRSEPPVSPAFEDDR